MTPTRYRRRLLWGAAAVAVAGLLVSGSYATGAGGRILGADEVNPCAAKSLNPCNPCGAKNPCNPCGAKNPCNPCGAKNPCNPCGAKNPCNPCGAKNPCNPCGAMNPCNPCGGAQVDPGRFKQPAGVKLAGRADLALGEKLWNDRFLGKSGLACANCHIGSYAQMNPTFKEAYPHYVAMPAQQGGVQEVSAAEMVQFCMLVPMMADPLPWDSGELASLAGYVESLQAGYRPVGGAAVNPCNPCAARNPCNPCNPCAMKNPCSPR